MNKKVAIIYGLAEGRAHGKKLRSCLQSEGFSLTSNLSKADIIIVHSGGVYLLPKDMKAKLVVMVGVPYWPGRQTSSSLKEKIKLELNHDYSPGYLVSKTFYNALYIIFRPLHHLRMWQNWKNELYPSQNGETAFIAVRNKNDTFGQPEKLNSLASKNGWNVVSLGGHHDDLWANPIFYVDLIKSQTNLIS